MARDLARVRIRADDESKSGFDSFTRNAQQASRTIDDLHGKWSGFLGALGVTVSVGAFAALVHNAISAQSALDDLSEMTSLTVEQLSSLERVAYIGGKSLGDVQPMASKFAKSVAEAAGGNEKLIKTFDALQISQERIKNGRFDEVFVEFATKIATMENRTYAIAYATELAGKAAATNIPFFRDLATEGLKQARVTTEQAAAAEELEKQWRRLRYEGSEWKNQLATELVPTLTSFVTQLRLAKELGGGFMGAMGLLFGTSASDPVGELNKTRESLEKLKTLRLELMQPTLGNRLNDFLTFPGSDTDLQTVNRQIAALEKRSAFLTRLSSSQGERDNFDSSLMQRGFQAGAPPKEPTGKEVESPFRGMMKGLLEQELSLRKELTAVDKLQVDLDYTKADALEKLTKKEREELFTVARRIDAYKTEQAISKSIIESIEAQIKVREELDAAVGGFHATNAKTLQDMQFETELLGIERAGLSGVAFTQKDLIKQTLEFNIARETAVQLRKLDIDYNKTAAAISADETRGIEEKTRAIEDLTRAYENQRQALGLEVRRNQTTRSSIEELRANQEEARRFSEDLNRSLTDALFRGFEAGKGFGRNFFDALKNYAKTTILQPIVRMIMQPVTNSIAGVVSGLGIPGLANAGTGGGMGALSNAGGLMNFFGGSSSPFSMGSIMNTGGIAGMGGGFGGIADFVSGYGSAAMSSLTGGTAATAAMIESGTVGFAGAGMEAAAGIGAAGGLSSVLPYAGALMQLAQGNVKGAAITGTLTAIGSMFGPIGAAAGAIIGSLIGGGKKKTPAVRTGGGVRGMASFSGFEGMSYATSANQTQAFEWEEPGDYAYNSPRFNEISRSAFTMMAQMGRILELNTSMLAKTSVAVDVTGVGDKENRADKFAEQINLITDQLALKLLPGIEQFAQANETLTQTFTRLAEARRKTGLERGLGSMSAALGLADSTRDLWLSDLSPLTNAQRLATAGAGYAVTRAQASAGDIGAMTRLADVARNYLTEARGFYASSSDYTRIFGEVQKSIGELVSNTLTEQSLALVEIGVTMQDIVANTEGLDGRIALAIGAAEQSVALGGMNDALGSIADTLNGQMAEIARQSLSFDAMYGAMGSQLDAVADQTAHLEDIRAVLERAVEAAKETNKLLEELKEVSAAQTVAAETAAAAAVQTAEATQQLPSELGYVLNDSGVWTMPEGGGD